MKRLRRFIFFILFEIVFCTILGACLVFYGPYKNIREVYVITAMKTMHHKYLATYFISPSEINRIMKDNEGNIDVEKENSASVKAVSSSDDVKIVNIKTVRYKGYLMIVSNPARVSLGISENIGQSGMTLSNIVKTNKAVGGINAGGFSDANWSGTGGNPSGIVIKDGKIISCDNSKSYDIVGFDKKNILIVGDYTLDEIKKMQIRDAICFYPPLVVNGKKAIKSGNGGLGISPRTAIGQRKDGAVLLLTIDGRRTDSIGASGKDLQDIMIQYDAYNASNLDGGSSTTMYYNGGIINHPSDILGERAIPSAFIVK